jgi:hypothetical protein
MHKEGTEDSTIDVVPIMSVLELLRLIDTHHAAPWCLSNLNNAVWPIWLTHAVSCSDHVTFQATSQGHSTARYVWIQNLWVICPGSVSSDYHAEFHD